MCDVPGSGRLRVHNSLGTFYLGNLTGPEHQVLHRLCDDDCLVVPGLGKRSVTIMIRTGLFPHASPGGRSHSQTRRISLRRWLILSLRLCRAAVCDCRPLTRSSNRMLRGLRLWPNLYRRLRLRPNLHRRLRLRPNLHRRLLLPFPARGLNRGRKVRRRSAFAPCPSRASTLTRCRMKAMAPNHII